MQVILFCIVAGIFGTCLGCLLLLTMGDISADAIHRILTLAGGFMTGVVCFDLVPEAFLLSGFPVTLAGLATGVVLIAAIDVAAHKIAGSSDGRHFHRRHNITHTHHVFPEHPVFNPEGDKQAVQMDESAFIRSGMMLLISIGLHNLPEGLAIGSGGSHDMRLGIVLAVMIALHNLPVGMAIAAPLTAGKISKGKVLLLSALSGAPTLAGGIAGMIIGNISNAALAFSLAGAGGTMLYVVFGEIIPQAAATIKIRIILLLLALGIALSLVLCSI